MRYLPQQNKAAEIFAPIADSSGPYSWYSAVFHFFCFSFAPFASFAATL